MELGAKPGQVPAACSVRTQWGSRTACGSRCCTTPTPRLTPQCLPVFCIPSIKKHLAADYPSLLLSTQLLSPAQSPRHAEHGGTQLRLRPSHFAFLLATLLRAVNTHSPARLHPRSPVLRMLARAQSIKWGRLANLSTYAHADPRLCQQTLNGAIGGEGCGELVGTCAWATVLSPSRAMPCCSDGPGGAPRPHASCLGGQAVHDHAAGPGGAPAGSRQRAGPGGTQLERSGGTDAPALCSASLVAFQKAAVLGVSILTARRTAKQLWAPQEGAAAAGPPPASLTPPCPAPPRACSLWLTPRATSGCTSTSTSPSRRCRARRC